MSRLVKIWLVVLAGAVLGVVVAHDAGYVLLSFGHWTVEMSLALLVLLLALLFGGLYFLIRLMVRTRRLPGDLRDWKQRRGARKAQEAMTRGLLEMSEGNWRAAEKRLVRHAEQSETPLLNYLAAARAAQLQGAHDRRDAYIRLAHEHMPSADVAVSLTQAELQLADNQLEQALATLRHLRQVAPRHTYVLRLLRRLYEQLGDWEHLRELIPELRRAKVVPPEELRALEIRTHRKLLENAFLSTDARDLDRAWAAVPKAIRSDPGLVGDFAGYLEERGRDEEAEKLLRAALRQGWDEHLVELYGLLDSPHPGHQLARMEKFLKEHPDDPVLLLTLGRLSMRARLWGKARAYLEASIARGGPVDAYRELARLLEHMGEEAEALQVYRKALAGSGDERHLIPLPENIGQPKANRPVLEEPVQPPRDADTGVEDGGDGEAGKATA
ncbi:MAG TPA: heme biosynthesis protein HemY [Gammaproteobacteria bacterium]|nr:heme biosynthesis protein HemY [Gammaproteobacteria bacterium]